MAVVFAEQELHNACQVLFGADLQISRGFFDYLQKSGIKSAYRKKARETHPDTVCAEVGKKSSELFVDVQQAYESLVAYVEARRTCGCVIRSGAKVAQAQSRQTARPTPSRNSSSPKKTTSEKRQRTTVHSSKEERPKPSAEQSSHYAATLYKGPLPRRKLLFGHFLYYRGLVSWQTITKALVWQRTKRPRIGEIGCRYGWLSSTDILKILQSRANSDTFGKSAVRQGFLTAHQLRLLLFTQKKMQKKFGQYFVANKILSEDQVNRLVRQFRGHNLSVSAPNSRQRTM